MAADVGVGGEKLRHRPLEDAHAVAVNDADAVDGGEGGGVEEFVDLFEGFFGALADDVEFAVGDVPARAGVEVDVFGEFGLNASRRGRPRRRRRAGFAF